MFEAKQVLFWYAASPVHMGAGTAVGGLIDNPIQREVHTGHPVLAGSGLKGALREVAESGGMTNDDQDVIFGPKDGELHAGALSVSDAQIVAFPVRALRTAFVWVTCPTALARLKRLLELADMAADWTVPAAPGENEAIVIDAGLKSDNGKLVLEAFAYDADDDGGNLKEVADWLAGHALPSGDEYEPFRDMLKKNLVLVRDEDFGHFVRFSTSVEPHVRIDNDTGTADDGGLFYTENLPPETIMASMLMATRTRPGKDENGELKGPKLVAEEVMEKVLELIDGRPVQIGGDATTGRGLMIVHAPQAG